MNNLLASFQLLCYYSIKEVICTGAERIVKGQETYKAE